MLGGKMRAHAIIGIALAGSALAATAAHCQSAAAAFDENSAALIQELATKAAAQKIALVPQPEGLVVNGRMIYYSGPGETIVGKTADEILTWSQQDLGGSRKRER
jgi:hypothetical protein